MSWMPAFIALAACGAVHVCGVAAEEHAAVAQRAHVAAVDPEVRTPVQVVEPGGQVHGAVVQSLNVLKRGIACVAGDAAGIGGHEPKPAVTHREDGEETVAAQEDRQLILRYIPSQVYVAKDVVMRQRSTRERQPERFANRAVRAVGGDQIRHVKHFLGAVTAAQHGRDAVAVLGQRDQLDAAFDLDALPVELFGEQPLGFRLSQKQHVVEFAWHAVQFDCSELLALRVEGGRSRWVAAPARHPRRGPVTARQCGPGCPAPAR
jgi:hypothetical protein